MKVPGRALHTGAKFGSAAVSRDPNAYLPLIIHVKNVYLTGDGLYLRKSV